MNALRIFKRLPVWLLLAAISVGGLLSYTSVETVEGRTPQRRMLILGGSQITPQSLQPLYLFICSPQYCFTDDGVTPAGNGNTVKRWVNSGTLGGYIEQATSGSRPVMTLAANGRYYLTFDGTDDFFSAVNAGGATIWTSGIFSAHGISTTATGYDNVYEGSGIVRPILWVDTSGRIELNSVTGPTVNNGAFRSILALNTAAPLTKCWVDGTVGINSASLAPASTSVVLNQFQRTGANGLNGKCWMTMFTSMEPTDAQVAGLTAWMAANAPN